MEFIDDRDIDLATERLSDAEAQYEELCGVEELTEDQLLEAIALYTFLYPDAVEVEE